MAGDLRSRFVRFVTRRKLVSSGDRVLLAVSGGVESMVMLHLVRESAAELEVEIAAAHFDHAMRAASAQDAEWLAGVCAAWGVPLVQERAGAALYGEAAARAARYTFLDRARGRVKAERIATAHHADDQIETVLFRILRGSGLRGLAGIPLRRGAIIRPLLPFRKYELEGYARDCGIAYRLDETNATDLYARNRIRRALIPVIQTIRPQAPAAILALARHAARAERAWHSLLRHVRRHVVLRSADGGSELARGKLLEYDAEIRARLLRWALRQVGYLASRNTTHALVQFVENAPSGSHYDVSETVRVQRAFDTIRITRAAASAADREVTIPECSNGAAVAEIGGKSWRVDWMTSHETAGEHEQFDCGALTFPLTLRGWRAGDRIRLSYGTKKLKKLFAERRIAFDERSAIPVLVDASGRVLWAAGIARASDVPAGPSGSALTITVTHGQIS